MLKPLLVVVALVLAAPLVSAAQTARVAPAPGFAGVRVSGRTLVSPGTEALDDFAQLLLTQGPGRLFRVPVRAGQPFVFDDVPPGTYRLSLQRNHGFQSVDVVVGREPVRNLELTFVRMFEVPVTIVVDDGTPPPARIGFRTVIGGRDLRGFIDSPAGPRPLLLTPGKTPVFLRPPAGYFVAALRADGVDLLRQPLELAPTIATPPTLTLTLTKTKPGNVPTFTVNGRITNDHPDLDVLLVDDADLQGPAGSVAGRTISGAAGEFSFRNVPAGVYTLHVPPARYVVRNIIVLGGSVDLTVPMPPGSIVVSSVRVRDAAGGSVPDWPGRISFVAVSGDFKTSVAVERQGFWSALPPGTYSVRIEGLPSRFSVKSLTAGSVDLLRAPFVVPAGRPAEVVLIDLEVPASEFPIAGQPILPPPPR